jgi:hypothetical protein
MNDILSYLAKQAGLHKEWYIDNPEIEKFAELIVCECAQQCEVVAKMANITNVGEMVRKTAITAQSCGTMIKQHFGVE